MSMTSKMGLSPGSMVFTGEQKVDEVGFHEFAYSETTLEETTPNLAQALRKTQNLAWINITGLHDTNVIADLGERFGVHPLTLEDIVSVGQRPKLESFETYEFIVIRMLSIQDGKLQNEQLSLILEDKLVLSFQEYPGDVLEPLRERIRKGKGRIRKLGSDYLCYAIMDIVVDHYFSVLEYYSEKIEELEQLILANPSPKQLEQVNQLKRELLFIRKAVWPLRELITSIIREESQHFSKEVLMFARDLYDHIIQLIDTVETLREMLTSLHDFYLSSISLKMNDVMKVLTIISTIFIPLGFLTGLYGMNFDVIPELHWRYGYFALLSVMVVVVITMLWYFRRKKWF